MAQTWTADTYDSAHIAATDLQNMENNFLALQSSFSGTSAPTGAVGGQAWHDSTARKIRNYANSAWLVSLLGDANTKLWHYRNDTCEGWLVDSSVTDAALAIKGGTAAYNTTGGNIGGTWTVAGLTNGSHSHSHVHQWYNRTAAENSDQTYNSAGTATTIPGTGSSKTYLAAQTRVATDTAASDASLPALASSYTSADATTTGSTAAVTSAATWRPRAAVGTLQYPDLS